MSKQIIDLLDIELNDFNGIKKISVIVDTPVEYVEIDPKYRHSIESIKDLKSVAIKEGKSLRSLLESSDKILYHVTFTKNIPKILSKGILPLQPSLWKQAASNERYGQGEIFAFDHLNDALRWAAKMDWAFNQKIGSGKIAIVKFNDTGEWDIDDADPISQIGNSGKWHKRIKYVPVSEIIGYTPVTLKMTRALAQDKPI